MRRIGILAKTSHHLHINLCKICNAKDARVTIFAPESLFLQMKEESKESLSEYEWVLQERGENNKAFLDRVEEICNDQIDLLLFTNGIYGEGLESLHNLSFCPNCKSLLWIHDVNSWFKPLKKRTKHFLAWLLGEIGKLNIKKALYAIKVSPRLIVKEFLLSRFDSIIVEHPPMKRYILENFSWRYEGKIFAMPLISGYEGSPAGIPISGGEKTKFVVPGIVSRKRRDYNLLLRVFSKLFPKYGSKVELYLLGRPKGAYGQKIIKHCEKLKKRGFGVYYYEKEIPAAVFRKILFEADVIISPLRLEFKSFESQELYGETKGTGVVSDCIRSAKPLIIPSGFKGAEELKTSVLKFRGAEELEETIEELVTSRGKLEKLQKEAVTNSMKFSLENLQKRFTHITEEI